LNLKLIFSFLILLLPGLLLPGLIFPKLALGDEPERNYILLERSKTTDSGYSSTTIGAFGLSHNMFAHLNLSYLESGNNGRAGAMDLGLGYAYKLGVTFFAGAGYMLGYNPKKRETINAYYPVVGVAAEFTPKFGVVVSGKRIFKIYDQTEDVILIGLIFSNK